MKVDLTLEKVLTGRAPNMLLGDSKTKFLQYMYFINLSIIDGRVEKESMLPLVMDNLTEEVFTLENIKRKVLTTPTDPKKETYDEVELDTIDLIAVRLVDESIEAAKELVAPLSVTKINPNEPAYAVYITEEIGSKYQISNIKLTDDGKSIDSVLVFEKPAYNFKEIVSEVKNKYISSDSFIENFSLLYNTSPEIEGNAFLFVYDDTSIDSITAVTLFTRSIGVKTVQIMSAREYKKKYIDETERNNKITFVFGGLDLNNLPSAESHMGDILKLEDDNIIKVLAEDNTLSADIVDSIQRLLVHAKAINNNTPKTIEYILNIVNKLKNKDEARFDTEILALKNVIMYSGAPTVMKIIANLIDTANAEEIDFNIIAKLFADSMGAHYSNAVRLTDAVAYNINNVDVNTIFVNNKDVEIVEMRANDFELECLNEYVRLNSDKKFVAINRAYKENLVSYIVIGCNYTATEMEDIIKVIKTKVLKYITNPADKEAFSGIVSTMVTGEQALYSFSVNLDKIFDI